MYTNIKLNYRLSSQKKWFPSNVINTAHRKFAALLQPWKIIPLEYPLIPPIFISYFPNYLRKLSKKILNGQNTIGGKSFITKSTNDSSESTCVFVIPCQCGENYIEESKSHVDIIIVGGFRTPLLNIPYYKTSQPLLSSKRKLQAKILSSSLRKVPLRTATRTEQLSEPAGESSHGLGLAINIKVLHTSSTH